MEFMGKFHWFAWMLFLPYLTFKLFKNGINFLLYLIYEIYQLLFPKYCALIIFNHWHHITAMDFWQNIQKLSVWECPQYITLLLWIYLYCTLLYCTIKEYVLYSTSLYGVCLVYNNIHIPVHFRPLQSLATLKSLCLSEHAVLTVGDMEIRRDGEVPVLPGSRYWDCRAGTYDLSMRCLCGIRWSRSTWQGWIGSYNWTL